MTYEPNRPPQPPYGQPPYGQPRPPYGPPPPLGYANGGPPLPPPRPTSVTVISVIGIVLAVLSLVCLPIAILPYVLPPGMMSRMNQPTNPMLDIARAHPPFWWFMIASNVMGFVMAMWLLIACIGALRLRPWGRSMSMVYAVVQFAVILAGIVFNVAYAGPLLMREGPTDEATRTVTLVTFIVGAVIGAVVGAILPACILIFYRRRHVIAAFNRPRW